MKTVYRFIKMRPLNDITWTVANKKKGNVLAIIKYDKQWRLWVLDPYGGTIWSADCLADVQSFIGQLGAEGGGSG